VHGVQLVQVGHRELAQTRLRLYFNKGAHMFFRILPLLHFSFQNFLKLVDFGESCCVSLLVPLPLLRCFNLDLLLDRHVVIFEATDS
jgi:hypothetical protein